MPPSRGSYTHTVDYNLLLKGLLTQRDLTFRLAISAIIWVTYNTDFWGIKRIVVL